MLAGFDAKPPKRQMRAQVDRVHSELITGALLMWPTATAPTGYLLCDGAAYSRIKYRELFAVLGTAYGAGDGSTTFNVPNYANRMPMAAGGLYAVGATGGSKDAVAVSHTHTASSAVTDPGHAHSYTSPSAANNNAAGGISDFIATTPGTTGGNTTGITVATTVSISGVSGTDANLPPYLAVSFIIKA